MRTVRKHAIHVHCIMFNRRYFAYILINSLKYRFERKTTSFRTSDFDHELQQHYSVVRHNDYTFIHTRFVLHRIKQRSVAVRGKYTFYSPRRTLRMRIIVTCQSNVFTVTTNEYEIDSGPTVKNVCNRTTIIILCYTATPCIPMGYYV